MEARGSTGELQALTATSVWPRRVMAGRANLEWLYLAVIAGTVALGIGLRIWGVLANRSFWSDESALIDNILTRSFSGLLLPLGDDQAAPIGWLLAQKALSGLLTNQDLALRLLPLISGILALVLFAGFCIRSLPRSEAAFAVISLALLPTHLLYAGEVKQYVTDLMLSAFVLLLTLRALEGGEQRWRRLLALCVCGLVAIPFSHPVAFVLGGAGTSLFLQEVSSRRYQRAIVVAGVSVLWLATFAALYLLVYSQHPEMAAAMRGYWQRLFAPVPPQNIKELFWYYKALLAIPESALFYGRIFEPGHVTGAALGAIVFLWGACEIARKDPFQAIVLLLPMVLALGASALQAYPFGSRFLMFAAPQILICIARGIGRLWAAAAVPRAVATAVPVLLLAVPLAVTTQQFTRPDGKPFETADSRTAMQTLAANYRVGDAIYVYSECLPEFRLQRQRYGLDDAKVLAGHHAPDGLEYFFHDVERMRQHHHVWILYCTHMQRELHNTYFHSLQIAANVYGKQMQFLGDLNQNWSVLLYRFDPVRTATEPAAFPRPGYAYAPSHPTLVLRNDEN